MTITGAGSRFVDTPEGLEDLAKDLAGEAILALDTEFIRERSYVPRLELVQVASRSGVVAAIDYGRLGRREGDPFAALLADSNVLKVFHAAEQDLEVLGTLLGAPLINVFDTQLAAGLAGYGAKPGYGALVEAVMGKRLPKGESMTDWSLRPLTTEQLAYALDDVRYLLEVYDRLGDRLNELGRFAWAQQEVERLAGALAGQSEARANPETLYMRVRGRGNLDAASLAVLRELAQWREAEAQRRDRPRGSILKDEMLVEIARRTPRTARHLSQLRGLHPRDLERYGETLVEMTTLALSRPKSSYPVPDPSSPPPDEATLALADLLQAIAHSVAAESGIAASLLATNSELQRLAETYRRGEPLTLPLMEGWRGTLLGSRLRDVLEGRAALGWDPVGQCLRLGPLAL